MFRPGAISALVTAALAAAPGTFTVEGSHFTLSHVYARKGPQTFDKQKESLFILAVDRELAPEVRVDPDQVRELMWSDKVNGVEVEFPGDGGASWLLKTGAVKASINGSRSPDPFKLTVTGERVKGRIEVDQSDSSVAKYRFSFDVDAVIERRVVVAEAEPTAADRAAAQKLASTKAYFALQQALAKGDKAAMMKLVDPEKAKMMDTPEFPQMLKVVQEMQPKNIQVLKATEKGDTAELIATGNGGKDRGKVTMERRNGAWLVMRENWSNVQ